LSLVQTPLTPSTRKVHSDSLTPHCFAKCRRWQYLLYKNEIIPKICLNLEFFLHSVFVFPFSICSHSWGICVKSTDPKGLFWSPNAEAVEMEKKTSFNSFALKSVKKKNFYVQLKKHGREKNLFVLFFCSVKWCLSFRFINSNIYF